MKLFGYTLLVLDAFSGETTPNVRVSWNKDNVIKKAFREYERFLEFCREHRKKEFQPEKVSFGTFETTLTHGEVFRTATDCEELSFQLFDTELKNAEEKDETTL